MSLESWEFPLPPSKEADSRVNGGWEWGWLQNGDCLMQRVLEMAWVRIPTPFTSCRPTLGKLCSFSKRQLPVCEMDTMLCVLQSVSVRSKRGDVYRPYNSHRALTTVINDEMKVSTTSE